jgi:hypothetical protein
LEALLSNSVYSLKNTDWTMVTWFRRTTATNDDFIFHIGAGDGYGGDGDELDLDLVASGQLQLRHYNTANTQDVNIASGAIPTGEWHHVAVVFDRTNNNAGWLMLYLDGAQVGASAPVSWSLNQSDALIFGGVKSGNEARWLNGNLDDVALYGTALAPGEIASLAAGRTVAQLGGLSRSNTVTMTVQFSNQQPVLSAIRSAGGTFLITVAGDGGPQYNVQISTNLLNWDTLFTTNSPPGGFTFGVTDTMAAPQKYYRIRLGP